MSVKAIDSSSVKVSDNILFVLIASTVATVVKCDGGVTESVEVGLSLALVATLT